MMKRKSQIIEDLRRSFYKRDEFLVTLFKRLEMFIFLNKEERERAIRYLRRTIIKEIIDVEAKKQLREKIEK